MLFQAWKRNCLEIKSKNCRKQISIILDESIRKVDQQSPRDIFLLLDEVPCNSDYGHSMCGRSSTGDWIDINSSGINLMVALKPVQDGSRGVVTDFFDWLLSREASIDLAS